MNKKYKDAKNKCFKVVLKKTDSSYQTLDGRFTIVKRKYKCVGTTIIWL